jgi:hypothetical protein
MSEAATAQVTTSSVIETFDHQFARLHAQLCTLIDETPAELLYEPQRSSNAGWVSGSIGEYVLRSAGVLEQTFGGLTANLWDDPFEWTLPETLSSGELIKEYLVEVEQTRRQAFESFAGDQDLLKKVAEPSGELRPLISLLLDTLVRAVGFLGRATAVRDSTVGGKESGVKILESRFGS